MRPWGRGSCDLVLLNETADPPVRFEGLALLHRDSRRGTEPGNGSLTCNQSLAPWMNKRRCRSGGLISESELITPRVASGGYMTFSTF